MKTIAQQLNIKEFPFRIKDKNGNILYYECSDGFWYRYEWDENGNELYSENSNGLIRDKRPKKCTHKVVTIDGVDYELKKIK